MGIEVGAGRIEVMVVVAVLEGMMMGGFEVVSDACLLVCSLASTEMMLVWVKLEGEMFWGRHLTCASAP